MTMNPAILRQLMLLVLMAFISACHPAGDTDAQPKSAQRTDGKTEVIVLGMIHGAHRNSDKYPLERLRTVIKDIDPDIILSEIPSGRVEDALKGYRTTGGVTESRTRAFPEYTDIIIPLHDEIGFWLVGTAGWTEEIAQQRTATLKAMEQNPERAEQWRAHQIARKTFSETVSGKSDDPLFIHSEAYDRLTEESFAPYLQYFEDDLGTGGWAAINTAHTDNIMNILDTVTGKGKRVLITYGAAHKYWIRKEVKKRDDIVLLDPIPYFTANTN